MIKKIKFTQIYLLSMLTIALLSVLLNIFIFHYYIFPQYIKINLHVQIEKIDNFFLKKINYISNILEYIHASVADKKYITNDFLDNLRFQSNILARHKNIWNSLLILDGETFNIENMIAYNANIAQLLEKNELDQIFSLLQAMNHCYICFLDEIIVNNNVYLPILYKMETEKKIIILILDPYVIEKELQKNNLTNNFTQLSFSYLNKLKQIKEDFNIKNHDNIIKINCNNKNNIKYSKLYENFYYEYAIPGTAENLGILININYRKIFNQYFTETKYIFFIINVIIITAIIIISYALHTIVKKNMKILHQYKKNNYTCHAKIYEMHIMLNCCKTIYQENLELKKTKQAFIDDMQKCNIKQRNLSLALENALHYNEIYRNEIATIIIKNKFHLDYFEYQKTIIINNKKKEEQLIEFIAIAGHEIKTPLYSIIGFIEIIQKHHHNIEKKFLEYIGYINECSFYILSLTNELIDIAKISDGSFTINKKIVNPAIIFEQCLKYVSQQADDKKINIILNIDDTIPKIFFDPQRIKQIIINILINSINYSDNNTVINVSIEKNNQDLIIKIQDNGYGIRPEDILCITNKYWNNNKYKKGFGIGLFLVKKLVKSHQGKMVIDSQINKGTLIQLIFENHFSIF